MIVIKKNIKNSKITLTDDVNDKQAIVIIFDDARITDLQSVRNKLSKVPYRISERLVQERG